MLGRPGHLGIAALVGGGPVWLTTDVSDVDQYGRSLRFVTDADGEDIGASLVDQGHAIASERPAGSGVPSDVGHGPRRLYHRDQVRRAPHRHGDVSVYGSS